MRDKKRELSRTAEIAMLCVSLLVVCAIALLAYGNIQAVQDALDQHKISQQIVDSNTKLLSLLTDAETAQRGYLLTGKELYLEPYHHAVSVVPSLLGRLDALAATMPGWPIQVRDLQPLIIAKLGELRDTIELRRAGK